MGQITPLGHNALRRLPVELGISAKNRFVHRRRGRVFCVISRDSPFVIVVFSNFEPVGIAIALIEVGVAFHQSNER